VVEERRENVKIKVKQKEELKGLKKKEKLG
jgi:hypothetical protein